MFSIHFLPADHGDCIWIEYGTNGRTNRVLIDGGTQHSFEHLTRKIQGAAPDPLRFELFVITHIDADHIGGSLELFRNIDNLGKKIEFGDVWFNGWKHLSDELGPKQAELVTDHLKRRKLTWNKAFESRAVVVPNEGDLPVRDVEGLQLTLLSPTHDKLRKLRKKWLKTIKEAELTPGEVKDKDKYFEKPSDLLGGDLSNVAELADAPFKKDGTAPNGSSIAFLAEFRDDEREISCLFTGDAHVDALTASIKRLIAAGHPRIKDGRLRVDLLKLSHHGSQGNISKELLELIDCPKFLFSTSGQQFKHPDREAVARVIKHGRPGSREDPKLYFNYRSKYNEIWDDVGLRSKHDYEVEYPEPGTAGLVISL